MVTNCWTVPILPTPLLLFRINISILRGSPSFITTMNTKKSMAGSLVRFLSGFLSEGETMLGFSFHGKEVKSELSKMRGSLVCIAWEIPGGGKSWLF